MFAPRHKDQKRTDFLPQIRVTPEQRKAVEWMAERLSERHGSRISLADVVRVALEELYARERADTPEGPT